MQDAIVRVIFGILGAGLVMAVLVPAVGYEMPAWAPWPVLVVCVAVALTVGRTKRRA